MELRAREASAAGRTPRHLQRWTGYARISPDLKRAVLLAEDSAFWQHEGVDLEQLQESIGIDWTRGRFVRGASTITQQLAKNLYLSSSRNPIRKLKEYLLARSLENHLTKKRILELYLNVVEMGERVYGAEAAARTYFHTSASALSPQQAALLAGCLPNPREMVPAAPTIQPSLADTMWIPLSTFVVGSFTGTHALPVKWSIAVVPTAQPSDAASMYIL